MANLAIIGISDWKRTKTDLLDLAAQIEAGASLPTGEYRLDFSDTTQLLAELPPRRLDTLRAIKRSGPVSIYAVAKTLKRHYPRILSWTRPSVLLAGCLARREEGAGAAPATTSNAARRPARSAIGCVALSPKR
jgi:predicted transcriptional regulator